MGGAFTSVTETRRTSQQHSEICVERSSSNLSFEEPILYSQGGPNGKADNTQGSTPNFEDEKFPIFKQLSEQDKKLRARILSELQTLPITKYLEAYFKEFEKAPPKGGIESAIEGIKSFAEVANLNVSERVKYYGNPLRGIHYENSFVELWNKTYPHQAITAWDLDFRRQAPPNWSYEFIEHSPVLVYRGKSPLSQGLNELILGPATMNCGQFVQLAVVMGQRRYAGDELFDRFIDKFIFSRKRQFVLTSIWNVPLNVAGSEGNLFSFFFDDPCRAEQFDWVETQSRICLKTVPNYPTYLARHPGGVGLLHNTVLIDGSDYIIFDPEAPHHIVQKKGLEQRLMRAYNAPRNSADLEKLWLYSMMPDYKHPDYHPKTFEDLTKEAERYANHIITDNEWNLSRTERQERAKGCYHLFNFPRFVNYVESQCILEKME